MTQHALLPHHLDHLRGSAIDEEVIAERGYRTVHRDSAASRDMHNLLKRCGIPGWARHEGARYPGILIPLYRATGEQISWQYRPDNPPTVEGKVRKYAAQNGRASVLDIHPRNRDRVIDPTVPLWITEGVKKGDALTTAGACAITLSGVFNWRSRLGTLGDWEDIPLKGRKVYVCFDADATTNRNVAAAMARLGRWLRSKGVDRTVYVVVPPEVGGTPVKGADDYLAAGGTLAELAGAGTSSPPDPVRRDAELSDASLAQEIADEVLDGRYCWSPGFGWMAWDGCRWVRSQDEAVLDEVRRYFLDKFNTETAAGCDGNRREALFYLLGKGKITAVTTLAKGIVLQDATEFDQHPDLLNTPTGVVDLTTKALLPHDPTLLLTKMTAAGYQPGATHPDWDAALECLPAKVRDWYQLRLGQAATGYMTPDDLMVVCQGGGENGKSTLNGAAGHALGEYFTLISDRVLLADASAHPTELMELRGARLALIEETPEARRLSVERLKKTVGTPLITARHIRRDSVTFDATHSLFISTNYRPNVEENDHGTWRRLALLRFPYRFRKPAEPLESPTDREGDPGLRYRLLNDAAALRAALAWMVDGAYRWYQADRIMPALPDAVQVDTRAWRSESDLILAYLDDRLVVELDSHVMATELLADFNAWLEDRGHRRWSDKTFSARFGEHQIVTASKVEKRVLRLGPGLSRPPETLGSWGTKPTPGQYTAWLGVRFKTESDIADEPEQKKAV